jgi:hypothetical protein
MEHGVYLCSWSRSPDGFVLYVRSHPTVQASGSTYAEAEERLINAIQDAGGAMQAVLEFDPPLPKSTLEAKYTEPEIFLISGDDRFETDATRGVPFETAAEIDERLKGIDVFFQAPICRKCRCPASSRSAKSLFLTYAPKRYDGAFGSVGNDSGPEIQLVSEEFLSLLSPQESQRLDLRSVNRSGKARKFYELIGPAGPPFVALAGLKISGWRCTQCNHRTWGYWCPELSIHSFIARSDLPSSVNGVFTVGSQPEIHLAVTASRWRELVGRKGTRGFTSQLLGVAPDREVVRIPDLPTCEETLRERMARRE